MSTIVEQKVEEALHNAYDNGYGGLLGELADEAIAVDLQTCSSEMEMFELDQIEAAVRYCREYTPYLTAL